MKQTTKRRLAHIAESFGAAPVPPESVRAAFAEFRETGILPDDERLAGAVVRRATTGYDSVYSPDGSFDWGATMQAALAAPTRESDPILESIYREAVHGSELVRWAARHVLTGLASVGHDVSQPQFAGWDLDVPEFAPVGLWLLGFPQRFAKPPYEERATDLFTTLEDLTKRIERRPRIWFCRLANAIEDFQADGNLPDDPLTRECVLASAELQALMDHYVGEDVAHRMLQLDEMQCSRKGTSDRRDR